MTSAFTHPLFIVLLYLQSQAKMNPSSSSDLLVQCEEWSQKHAVSVCSNPIGKGCSASRFPPEVSYPIKMLSYSVWFLASNRKLLILSNLWENEWQIEWILLAGCFTVSVWLFPLRYLPFPARLVSFIFYCISSLNLMTLSPSKAA